MGSQSDQNEAMQMTKLLGSLFSHPARFFEDITHVADSTPSPENSSSSPEDSSHSPEYTYLSPEDTEHTPEDS